MDYILIILPYQTDEPSARRFRRKYLTCRI